jgi:hypothetical protein
VVVPLLDVNVSSSVCGTAVAGLALCNVGEETAVLEFRLICPEETEVLKLAEARFKSGVGVDWKALLVVLPPTKPLARGIFVTPRVLGPLAVFI